MNNCKQKIMQVQEQPEVGPLGMVDEREPKTVQELFGDKPSPLFDDQDISTYFARRFEMELQKNPKLLTQTIELDLRERRSVVNTNNAITGMVLVWSLIGMVMLGRSCINTDSGPKFKV
jgi:hypothetical protein